MVRRLTLWVALSLGGAGCDDGSAPGAGDMSAGSLDMRPAVDMASILDRAFDDMAPPDVMPPDVRVPDGMPTDVMPFDMAVSDLALPDMVAPDMAAPDMAAPDMAPPVAGAGSTAGAARLSSPRFSLTVSVGGPSPTAQTTSPRFRARLGVGALSIPTPAEVP